MKVTHMLKVFFALMVMTCLLGGVMRTSPLSPIGGASGQATRDTTRVGASGQAMQDATKDVSSLSVTRDTTELKREIAAIKRFLADLNEDREYRPYLPKWEILDLNIKAEIIQEFEALGYVCDPSVAIIVVADPPDSISGKSTEIVRIEAGHFKIGRVEGHLRLPQWLRQTILERKYSYQLLMPQGYKDRAKSRRQKDFRVTLPRVLTAKMSLFENYILWNPFPDDPESREAADSVAQGGSTPSTRILPQLVGFVGRVGDDQIGYPFWSSGQASVLLAWRGIRIGARLPVHGGLRDFNMGLSQRLLNGSSGVTGEFEFEWDPFGLKASTPNNRILYSGIGGSFAACGMSHRRRTDYLTENLDNLYSISTILQAYYAFDWQISSDPQHKLNVKCGASFHRVTQSKKLFEGGEIVPNGDPTDCFRPILAVKYYNQGADWFSVGAQLSRMLMISAWAEVVPKYLAVEIKYSTPLLPAKPEPWERTDYFYGTLVTSFDF
jgi:hypothetical protein